MLIDAKFNPKAENGVFSGVSKRGVPVSIRDTATVRAALERCGYVLTVQCIAELYERYHWHKKTVECVLPHRIGIDGKPVKFNAA